MRLLVGFAVAVLGRVLLSNLGLEIPLWAVVPAALGFAVLLSSRASSRVAPNGSPWAQEWDVAANELDLSSHVRTSKGKFSTMRGEMEGHRVNVYCFENGDPEIEVRFESGLRSFDIDPRRRPARPADLMTGDSAFDDAFIVHSGGDDTDTDDDRVIELVEWLTPQRREILLVLNDALDLQDIEEDELEVKLGTKDWTSGELVQAVQLCVLVAQTLDRSYRSVQSPQDAIRPSDSPQDAPLSDYLRSDDPQAETPKDGTGPESFD